MRAILVVLGVLICLAAAVILPIPPVQKFVNATAFKLVENGNWESARKLYIIGEIKGDPIATNNFHVLNYRRAIDGEGLPKEVRREIAAAAKVDFEELMADGYAPAAFNRAMFNYKCSTKRRCFNTALEHFSRGVQLGDTLSQDALDLMQAKHQKGDSHYELVRNVADRGNAWAAHRYARSLRFDRDKLKQYGEPYAVMAAEYGIADAQNFLATYFSSRPDVGQWLEKAATNPVNRSVNAAQELARISTRQGDFGAARKWYKLAATPRDGFDYNLIKDPEGLRWRGYQGSRSADINNSQSAAYELALMHLNGIGGPVNKKEAIKLLEYAEYWKDTEVLLEQLKSGEINTDGPRTGTPSTNPSLASLKAFDKHKTMPFYDMLRPYVARGQIRRATAGFFKNCK